MISTALMLLANTLLFSLRLERGSSFPRPLSAAEERECLDRLAQGDPEARNTLIEHNLRLVAHIVKCRSGRSDLHRDHRTHQGHFQLRPNQGRPAGHLCGKMY